MRPLAELDQARAAEVRVLFADIDDTLTTDGRLTSAAFGSLWALAEAGVEVVPVTGRPAGWCDHIARMWPVAAVVGENGGLCFAYDRERRRMDAHFALGLEERLEGRRRLEALRDRILREVPGSGIASDQPYRLFDLAIDFREDVPALPMEEVARIVGLFEAAGATAKVSSIHVNGWFGSFDKVAMIRWLARARLSLDLDAPEGQRAAAYVGDSPNDEPAFAFFDLAIGVANVRRFAPMMTHRPRFVTAGPSGEGFAELANHLLAARASGAR